jgi:thiamine biosynthesis lipoprotein
MRETDVINEAEASESFDCLGSSCGAWVTGASGARSARDAVKVVKRALRTWHWRFSRFSPDSELCGVNEDTRAEVAVSPLMARLAQAAVMAGSLTDGLVDATLVGQIERAGYVGDLPDPLPLALALALAPPREPAAPAPEARWREIDVDTARGIVRRAPGVMIDSGGLAKGLFADVLAKSLSGHSSFAINCAGDLFVGGSDHVTRAIDVESPFDGRVLHTFHMRRSGVATSGIGRRSWMDRDGHPAHHLLDPFTGRPAFTGIVQATALAPSALMAEIYAKAAVLSGPRMASAWLRHGGLIVLDDGSHRVIDPPPVVTLGQLGAMLPSKPGERATAVDPISLSARRRVRA